MANDKKNINELVSEEDDPTAELETLALKQLPDGAAESTADTSGIVTRDTARGASIAELQNDLEARSETINRLQFDIEQLRARWTGLETEIKAREEITRGLNDDLDEVREALGRKERLLKKRDLSIKSLKAEIRERNKEYGELQDLLEQRDEQIAGLQDELTRDRGAESEEARQRLEEQAGQIATARKELSEQQAQIERTEAYADALRQQLQDATKVSDEAEDTREYLQLSVDRARSRIEELAQSLAAQERDNAELREALKHRETEHAEEIRKIRFELGEAQETVAQHELIAEQLASDLVETRGFRNDLEQMLTRSEEESNAEIDNLEKENQKLRREVDESREKLETKSDAINCLLAELAKKTQQLESISEIEEVIQEIDDRMSERIDDSAPRDKDRVTRVLIGSVEGQELRFPLFKDRLTIGRTDQNDIQLKASYVSRRHAVVVTERDATRIVDWGSKNGVFVNSKRITEHFLKTGDVVTIGTADFRYEERPKRDA